MQRMTGRCKPLSALLLSGLQCNLKPPSLRLPYSVKQLGAVSSSRQQEKMHSRPASIAELRETALPLLSVQAFKSLMWLGVHGKFAYSAEDEPPSAGDSEDVDVIAVWDPNSERAWHPSHADRHTRLENTLGKAWKREIYLSDITDGKLGDNTHTDAMLFSRTIYGSAQNQLVTKLREEARAIVDQELDIYSGVSRKVKEMQAWVAATGVEV